MADSPEVKTEISAFKAHQFRKGVSGNPGGRPKGMASYIRELTDDGRELARILYEIATDDRKKAADRIRAVELLTERSQGKVPDVQATLALEAQSGEPAAQLASAYLEQIARALLPASTSAPQAVSEAVVDGEIVPNPSDSQGKVNG